MKFLTEIHSDISTNLKWRLDESTISVGFNSVDDVWEDREFEKHNDNRWVLNMENFHTEHVNTYIDIVSAFAQMKEKSDNLILEIHTKNTKRDTIINMARVMKHVHDYLVYEREGVDGGTIFVLCKDMVLEHTELLMEEPNTSLMYHKLFPNKRLMKQLEALGYTFQMGSGLKIYKKYYSSTHRGSGPSQRRTLQSVVLMKDGSFFRKIPKAKWVQLADPSDKDSLTWGELFMKKILADHQKKTEDKRQKLLAKREERLNSKNP